MTRRILRPCRSRLNRKGERGSALLELAIGSTMLLYLLIGALDYGPIFYNTIELDAGARSGAIYGSQSVAHSADITGMQTIALNNIVNLQGVTATATQTCKCPDDMTTNVACTTTCPNNGLLVVYANVTTQWVYTPTFEYPYVAYPLTFIRTASMRAQ